VSVAVQAMKAGARDFIEKPIGREELIASIEHALELSQDSKKMLEWRESAVTNLARLTPRQVEVMERVLAGQPSKNIAAELGISRRTVENHRASIMKRTRSKSLPDLARLALVAAGGDPQPPTAAPMGRGVRGVRLARQPSNTTDANSSVSNGCPASAVPNGAHSAAEGSLGRPSVRPA
jgi:DNA-binding CsgD family transcriptional regulator